MASAANVYYYEDGRLMDERWSLYNGAAVLHSRHSYRVQHEHDVISIDLQRGYILHGGCGCARCNGPAARRTV